MPRLANAILIFFVIRNEFNCYTYRQGKIYVQGYVFVLFIATINTLPEGGVINATGFLFPLSLHFFFCVVRNEFNSYLQTRENVCSMIYFCIIHCYNQHITRLGVGEGGGGWLSMLHDFFLSFPYIFFVCGQK